MEYPWITPGELVQDAASWGLRGGKPECPVGAISAYRRAGLERQAHVEEYSLGPQVPK